MKWRLVSALLALAIVSYAAWDWYRALPLDALDSATYVGRQQCATCHPKQLEQWAGSHHDKAMELASEQSVLGDFDDASFSRLGVTSRFFRRDGKFWVNTESRDGQLSDHEIKYTFGISPLQQYMVEFEDGRVQVLRTAWDTVKKQWFYVSPPDAADEKLSAGDPMHWTGLSQNWNTMCAECHSTNLQKNYDLETNSFATTFSEIDVSCETCHGPASVHVELANSSSIFWDRHVGYGLANLKSSISTTEIETCAACHSRRSIVKEGFRPGKRFDDFFNISLLHEGLYHADGQILDEVYVYGSFQQSLMHSKGVRCSDCHDPHSLQLKFQGNRLCSQCHQPGKYDTPAHHHHHHAADSAGSQCIECHMPSRTYMEIDPRRDHSFRIPRPDLSEKLGTPNACTGCHTKEAEDAGWASRVLRDWYGPHTSIIARRDDSHGPRWASAFAAGRAGDPKAVGLLKELIDHNSTPEIVRATAVSLLANFPGVATEATLRSALNEKNTMVRAAAIQGYQTSDPLQLRRALAPRLEDRSLRVRMQTGMRLLDLPPGRLAIDEQRAMEQAIDDYRESQFIHLERAAAHMNLGSLAERLGRAPQAAQAYRNAIRLEPYLTGPRSQLALLLDAASQRDAASQLDGNERFADEVILLRREEVGLLERDTELLPDHAPTFYRLGLLRYLLGDLDEADAALTKATELAPNSFDFLMTLALLKERRELWPEAIEVLKQMQQLQPTDPRNQQIYERIRQTMGK